MDRFLIGSLLSLAALSYYTAPYEAVARLSILPGSLMLTLFPAFSSSGSSGNQEKLKQLYVRSVKFLLLVVGPAMLVLVAFARNILLMWLGRDFATNSTLAFQVLAFGFFLNALLAVPFTLLQGLGRADITAKFHLIELVVYVPLLWLLTERLGISGTAIAWTSRVVMDGLLLFGGAWRLYQLSLGFLFRNACARSGPLLLGFGTLLFFIEQLGIAVLLKSVLAGLIGGFFVWGAWHFVLDAAEKGVILSMLRNATPTTSTGR
jgi:peptidoglycan biosynthesis protein MviN/MurJ (putative lipid II flippase)